MRIIRGLFIFTVGLVASLIAGWWFNQRQRQSQSSKRHETMTVRSTASGSLASNGASEPEPIVLPPEAFEDIEDIDETSVPGREVASEVSTGGELTDDLTELKGIGPKTAEALNNMGIYTFAALAKANVEELRTQLPNNVSVEQIESWISAAGERA
jgi:predicted flap endonuclease-1-like 5' DNA nuclease